MMIALSILHLQKEMFFYLCVDARIYLDQERYAFGLCIVLFVMVTVLAPTNNRVPWLDIMSPHLVKVPILE